MSGGNLQISDIKAPFMGAIPYSGNKQKLLPHLLPLFPNASEYNTFVDLFAGGLSVSLTMSSMGKKVIANDNDHYLISLYEDMKEWEDLSEVKTIMQEYGLCKTNKEAFIHFRDEVFNKEQTNVGFYALLLHSFSNLNRRNSDGDFNAPFGYRSLNSNTEKRFNHFKKNCSNIEFVSSSFEDVTIPDKSFVYVDPPYLISDATYNKGWTQESDDKLMNYLDSLTERGILWGMSNVLRHRDRVNTSLIKWSEKYTTHNLSSKYVLGAHILSDKELSGTEEVFICNY